MKISHMLIRSNNIPTDLSSEYKIMEGPEDIIKEICNILNGVVVGDDNPFLISTNSTPSLINYYSIKEIEEDLYDGYREVYGYEEHLTLKDKFDKEKYNLNYKGKTYDCNLSNYEFRKIYKGEL